LLIGVRDTESSLTIKSWFSNQNKRLETIVTSDDGHVLVENQVQQLVDAMSVFNVQQQGNLNISQQDVESVQTVITEVWS
jgi:acetolactate synthase regulatory subunit